MSSPIGNLDDITIRALDILRRADRIYAEDKRVTAILLDAYDITTPLASYHDHNGALMRPKIISHLHTGASAALISDAGTPLISDPGLKLVQAAVEAGIAVFPIPGACAAMAALTISGLPSDRFIFAGFPPQKRNARKRFFREVADIKASLIFFEGPSRLAACLADMIAVLGDRKAALARELTKKFEQTRRDKLSGLAAGIAKSGPPKGECVLVVGPPEKAATHMSETDMDQLIAQAPDIMTSKDLARTLSLRTGVQMRELYARIIAYRATDKNAVSPERRKRYKLGIRSEYMAALWLIAKGYRIHAMRFKSKAGEIDLIARKGNCIVFVEVKSRTDADTAVAALTPTNKQRLRQAAEIWLMRQTERVRRMDQRFDVIAMVGTRPVRHIRNALPDEGARRMRRSMT